MVITLAPLNFLRVLGDAEVLLAGQVYWVRAKSEVDWVVEVSWSEKKYDISSHARKPMEGFEVQFQSRQEKALLVRKWLEL